jgi:hypothetical protein
MEASQVPLFHYFQATLCPLCLMNRRIILHEYQAWFLDTWDAILENLDVAIY